MRQPERDEARRQPGSGEATSTAGTRKPTGGRPEAQGNRTARNACQPAPTWPVPGGQDAALMLEKCWMLRRRT